MFISLSIKVSCGVQPLVQLSTDDAPNDGRVCLMQIVCALRVYLSVWTAMQAMFNPPDPLEFKEPVSKRKSPSVDGISAILDSKPGLFEMGPPPPQEEYETPRQRHARIAASKREVKL